MVKICGALSPVNTRGVSRRNPNIENVQGKEAPSLSRAGNGKKPMKAEAIE
jgi:hypothetical protein